MTKDLFERRIQQPGPLGQHAYFEGEYIFPELEGELGPRMLFKGEEHIIWSINNYLGLANHPRVRRADTEATEKWGLAYPMGSRLLTGQTSTHKQLENDLADFVQKEEAFLLNYGYQAVVSIVDSLLDRRDVVVYDEESHACIMDGIRMHKGGHFAFKHNDIDQLKKQLERATQQAEQSGGGILVITEGVFGMSGDLGALAEIIELRKLYNFRLFVDDAHGFGTMGKTGFGTGEALGVQGEIDLYFSTFAKSMASIGAFVAGSKEIIQYLKYNMRSQIFAKALPSPIVESAFVRLQLLREHSTREALWKNVNHLQTALREAGFELGNTASPVTPVFLQGDLEEALALNGDLRKNHKIFCSLVVYPVVPKGVILLRLIPTAVHTTQDIEATIEAFTAVRTKLISGAYRVGV